MIVSMKRLRVTARKYLSKAVVNGALSRPNGFLCVDCGDPAQCYDHRDYTKPLDVDPVCKKCDAIRGPGMPLPNSAPIDVKWITRPPRVVQKYKRNEPLKTQFNLRLTSSELSALRKLSEIHGITLTDVVANMIRRAAKRKKVWVHKS